ncbi:transcriptional regulator [Algiphilus sp.]|uniref:transcriptional regulator n=1 Tax=Algiphilus sp. TaxID=1872431 RepID=UPI003CCC3336
MNYLDHAINLLDGLTAFAKAVGASPQRVANWRTRGVPRDEAPKIEIATNGEVTCEQLCPGVRWVRDDQGIHYVVTCDTKIGDSEAA